jgi:hypothetical protein
MAVTRSHKPKSGSPTPAAPVVTAPATTSKNAQKAKSKAKAEKKTAATTGPKPAKVQKKKKKKIPKRKGPKSASKEPSPEAPPPATPKSTSKAAPEGSPQAIAEAALEEISNSEAVLNPHDLTAELMEEMGLTYADIFSLHNAHASSTTQAESMPPPRQPFLKTVSPRNRDGKVLPKGFWYNPYLLPEHLENGPPFGAHSTSPKPTPPPAGPPTAAPAEFPHGGGRSFWNYRSPLTPQSESTPQPTTWSSPVTPQPTTWSSPVTPQPTTWASPITPSFGAQRSATPKSSPVKRVFFGFPRRPSSAVPQPADKLSPRGVQAGKVLLGVVEAAATSPPVDYAFAHPFANPFEDFDFSGPYAENVEQRNPFIMNSPDNNHAKTKGPPKSPTTIIRGIVNQVEQQQQHDEAEAEAEEVEEEERPESPPVEVNNAQVFKRPTVADLRRERAFLHKELEGWVASLQFARQGFEAVIKEIETSVGRLHFARQEFEAVIKEVETRMGVLKAVDRMQAPLRKAPLGGGRGRGKGR